jgi:hypothetical protein
MSFEPKNWNSELDGLEADWMAMLGAYNERLIEPFLLYRKQCLQGSRRPASTVATYLPVTAV